MYHLGFFLNRGISDMKSVQMTLIIGSIPGFIQCIISCPLQRGVTTILRTIIQKLLLLQTANWLVKTQILLTPCRLTVLYISLRNPSVGYTSIASKVLQKYLRSNSNAWEIHLVTFPQRTLSIKSKLLSDCSLPM